jgi:hypothetical protein
MFNSALCEVPGGAKIRTSGATWATFRVRTRPADHRHDEITWAQTPYTTSDLDHFRERFMAENQMIRSGRRAAIFEGTDFTIRATETYLVHAEQHVGCVLQLWLR